VSIDNNHSAAAEGSSLIRRFFKFDYAPSIVGLIILFISGCSNNASNCDILAADPDDPHKIAKGVLVDDMDTDKAIEACLIELEENPENERLQFQLGRVLMAAGHSEEALPLIEKSAEKNYPAALGYMGHLQETDSAAVSYYHKAAKGDYTPAKEALAKIAKDKEAETNMGQNDIDTVNDIETSNDLFAEGYHASKLMEYIYSGKFDDIPDDRKTRALVVSVFTSFNKFCGEGDTSIGAAAIKYGSEEMRQMQRDPAATIAKNLLDIVRMRDSALATGDVMGSVAEYAKKRSILSTEGLEDGQRFVTINGCSGDVFYQFRDNLGRLISQRVNYNPAPHDELKLNALLSPEYRRRNNIPDPSKELRTRALKSYADRTQKGCMDKYEDQPFCTCLAEKLGEINLSDENRAALAKDFKAFPTIVKEKPVLLSTVRFCRGG